MNNDILLVCKEVLFYSDHDEASFFEWINKISAIQSYEGVSDKIQLCVARGVQDNDLRELIALFYRYTIDMKQLQQFVTDINQSWFTNKQSYWYSKVFDF